MMGVEMCALFVHFIFLSVSYLLRGLLCNQYREPDDAGEYSKTPRNETERSVVDHHQECSGSSGCCRRIAPPSTSHRI